MAYTRAPRDAGWSSPVARQAHNLKVTGSNPVPATIVSTRLRSSSDLSRFFVRTMSPRGRGPSFFKNRAQRRGPSVLRLLDVVLHRLRRLVHLLANLLNHFARALLHPVHGLRCGLGR